MAIQAVIFDLSGVVLQTIKGTFNSLLAERLGVPLEDVEPLGNDPMYNRWDLAEISDDEFYTFMLTKLQQPPEKKPILAKFMIDDFIVDPILLEFIHDLHKDYQTALLTNFPSNLYEGLNSQWIVEDAFDHIIASCDVKLLKPDERMYRKALEILDCQPEEVIFIDDREVNVRAAETLGIRSVLYAERQQGIRDIKRLLENN